MNSNPNGETTDPEGQQDPNQQQKVCEERNPLAEADPEAPIPKFPWPQETLDQSPTIAYYTRPQDQQE